MGSAPNFVPPLFVAYLVLLPLILWLAPSQRSGALSLLVIYVLTLLAQGGGAHTKWRDSIRPGCNSTDLYDPRSLWGWLLARPLHQPEFIGRTTSNRSHVGKGGDLNESRFSSSVRSAMCIETAAPCDHPSSVGAA